MKNWAIVCTVDAYDRMPKRGVYLFDSKSDAMDFAVEAIRKSDPQFTQMKRREVLDAFQDLLSPTEYFHIIRVRTGKD